MQGKVLKNPQKNDSEGRNNWQSKKKMVEKNLRLVRRALRLTQEDFAQMFGVGRSTVAKWETGENDVPTKVLAKLEELSGIEMIRLYQEELTNTEIQKHIMTGSEAKELREALKDVAEVIKKLSEKVDGVNQKVEKIDRKVDDLASDVIRLETRKK